MRTKLIKYRIIIYAITTMPFSRKAEIVSSQLDGAKPGANFFPLR